MSVLDHRNQVRHFVRVGDPGMINLPKEFKDNGFIGSLTY